MGPLNTARQRDYVPSSRGGARAGAEVLEVGEYSRRRTSGNYMLPSLVLDPAPDLRS